MAPPARGHKAVGADMTGLSELVSVPEVELTGPGPGKDWVWHGDRIHALLPTPDADVLFVRGHALHQGEVLPQFHLVLLLTTPAAVIAERLATRTTNPFGKHPDQLEPALLLQHGIVPLLRPGAGLEVDTAAPRWRRSSPPASGTSLELFGTSVEVRGQEPDRLVDPQHPGRGNTRRQRDGPRSA